MSTAQKRRTERLALLLVKPPRSLTLDDVSRIRFTQTHIHTQFSNNKSLCMDVFDTYFVIKFGLMSIEELPPIRIYQYQKHLWSIDNRRLWIMREAGQFYYEGPYTKDHSITRFMELESKHSSLHGTSGQTIQFHSNDSSKCCVNAWTTDTLDEHQCNDHLNLTFDQFQFLIQCPIHHSITCQCLEIKSDKTRTTSLTLAITKRCRLIQQLAAKANLVLNTRQQRLINRFNQQSFNEHFARLVLQSSL